MQDKYKILCFLDNDSGRDVEILMPLIYYAENFLNSDIEFAFIWDIHAIYRKKPDLVLLANSIGSNLHHDITKYAYDNNIKVFSLISEGNFRTNGTFNYWGYNTEKRILQEFVCLWSERTLKFLQEEIPESKSKMVLTGAIGFDRYKIYDFESKNDFLKRWNLKQYEKIIGYAGWTFGKLFNETGIIEIRNAHKEKADERIEFMKEQMLLVENTLRKAIENNPDTLFVLKRHPNEIHPHLTQKDKNEMINLSEYQNVLYVRNEEDIHTLISISDIWLGFETTSVIETWLMKDTPTVFINPDPNFKRDKNYKGTVIVKSYQDLQDVIDEFYSTGRVESFLQIEKQKQRELIIHNTIGFSDGLNHIRAAYYLKKVLSNIEIGRNKAKLNLKYLRMFILMHIGKVFFNKKLFLALPKFKKTVWIFERFRLKNLMFLKKKYFNFMDVFYEKNNIKDKIEKNEFWNELLNIK